jgi:hypothetical protein
MSELIEQAHDPELGAPCVSAEDLLVHTQRTWGRALRRAGAQPDICVVADARGAPILWAQVRDAAAPPAPCPPPANSDRPSAQIRGDSCEAELVEARLVVDEAMRGALAGAGGAKSAPLLRVAAGYGLPIGKAAGPGASVDLSGVIPVYDGARHALGVELNAWHGAGWLESQTPWVSRTEIAVGVHHHFQQDVRLLSPEASLLIAGYSTSFPQRSVTQDVSTDDDRDDAKLLDYITGAARLGIRIGGGHAQWGVAGRVQTVRVEHTTRGLDGRVIHTNTYDPILSLQLSAHFQRHGRQ